MEKQIIATNIDGFLIKHSAFIEPHKDWFKKRIKETGDESLRKWIGREDYFLGVDKAMKQLMPEATDNERTRQARRWYQEEVINYIKEHPECIYKEVIEILKKLKEKYTFALVTSNSREYINEILKLLNIKDLYSIILASGISEKPDKADLLGSFLKKYKDKTKFYIAARNQKVFELIKNYGIKKIYAAWDEYNEEVKKSADKLIKNPYQLLQL